MEKVKKKLGRTLCLILLGVIIGVVGVLLVFAVRTYLTTDRPSDLGSKLEYIGKVNKDCFPVCGDPWTSTYFFATDMTFEEIKEYFSKAKYIPSDIANDNSRGYRVIGYKSSESDGGMQLYFYDDITSVPERVKSLLEKSRKKYAVRIYSVYYTKFKSALE